ncbi:S8 family serine peptidase [Verrucosispora sp. WMMD573]|uniref:S8 family serine peptidase n=1 Tax=Verrucosispora sp. WMMD573 TaxID=3015149 RepID=UPI00248C9016|nr:S8 family serine peptidase [Verrucosispora sp. WMMD573]WBB54961.1 S8 family serine peptidase [Verrucosispora sp. WMMD573]
MRRRSRLTTTGLVLGLVLGVPAAVTAAPATPTVAPLTPVPSGRPDAGRGPATVTLITGDQVTVTATGASVRPAEGRDGVRFVTRRERDHLWVMPQDALPLIRDGRVDRRLFDVAGLIAAGYDDAHRDELPLLMTYGSTARRAGAPEGVTVTRDLAAIGGVAATADKQRVGQLWATLAGASGARIDAAGGVERIWLDGRRQLTLEHSVPQIGAPAAHQAGFTGQGVRVAVLDSGVDAAHPDLTGRVAESRNFSEDANPGDIVGHGTHVASIIAGSGAASGGRNRGVAPDATLLSGKVCEEYGCAESAILAGMQWAAAEAEADVVNISLGGADTPEVDPLEEAVNTLTEQTGALFVISAGNAGGTGTVGSPASADAALAVGAVDREDQLADFSSRGPRVGDDALKPDITAPGVDIVAARGQGTQLGEPVGEQYVSLSGTSMSAPHVAGAAALLAQQHTGATAQWLKATLMASARPHPELTAYQQGAGRVDVARAITQSVVSEPASVSFGRTLWPHDDDEPIQREVTWRNTGTAPLTLDLSIEATGPDGKPVPAGVFTLGAQQVQVPAGGTASATLTVDTSVDSPDGHYTGRVVARAGDLVAVTPLAVHKEVESYTLTLRHLSREGDVPDDYASFLLGLDDFTDIFVSDPDGTAEVRVPKGRYGLASFLFDEASEELVLMAQPELVVESDAEVVVDARTAKPVRMTVPDRSATPALVAVDANFLFDDGSAAFGAVADDFGGLFTGQVGGRTAADHFFTVFSSQFVDLEAASSPYLYALAEMVPGRMPAGLTRHYRDSDLATVKQTFRDGYPGTLAERMSFAVFEPDLGGWAIGLPVAVPGHRVEYYNTRQVRWSTELWFGTRSDDAPWLEPVAVLFSEPTAYRGGRSYREVWNGAPHGPSFPVPRWPDEGLTRQGDLITLSVPLHSDAAGHLGSSLTEASRTALYRNGKLVDETTDPGWGQFEVPAAPARYRLETSAKRTVTDLSTEVATAWTFRSRHVRGDDPLRLPASAIRFAPRLDERNGAPAGRSFVIPVAVQRQPGAPTAKTASLTVDVSYDGGKRWQRAKLRKVGSGWQATVQHPRGTGHVSLRATARDTDGNTVTQRIIQAYRLR